MKPFINLIAIFINACLLTSCLATDITRVSKNNLVRKGDLYYLNDHEAPFSGIAADSWTGKETNLVTQQCTYLNGRKHGEELRWINGSISFKGNFSNGKYHGTFKSWCVNGQLQNEMNFRNGVVHGPYVDYNTDGSISEKRIYKDGKQVSRELFEFKDRLKAFYYDEDIIDIIYNSKFKGNISKEDARASIHVVLNSIALKPNERITLIFVHETNRLDVQTTTNPGRGRSFKMININGTWIIESEAQWVS